ncbi:tRNA(Met) cytidine acetyltransferase [Halobacteriales archaeon QS_3_64_16]|nr:MAG: tRNA(Met) cytidine acetyltransferase [Halobacteriales archaeon QS_3_64_16]
MTVLAALVSELHAEARRTNERRLLVLHGSREACYESAREVLAATGIDRSETILVGECDALPVERVAPNRTETLLGTTTGMAVIDAQDSCRPNALGRVIGTVDGGGLVIFLALPLEEWADRRDAFDASLAVFPYNVGEVSGAFRARLVDLLRTHPGIAIVDSETHYVERDGLIHPAPRLSDEKDLDRSSEGSSSADPGSAADDAVGSETRTSRGDRSDRGDQENGGFPATIYERCLTADQEECVRAFERLERPGTAVVAEADRGRGKSSAAGLAAGALAASGRDVLVTAPNYRASKEIFARAATVLDDLGVSVTREGESNPRVLDTGSGSVRFVPPTAAADLVADPEATHGRLPGGGGTSEGDIDPDVVFVDEAAGLPVSLLDRLLAADRLAFTTTVHGYEGAGRGFSIRFRERLAASDHEVLDARLDEPIRYAAGDPIEVWLFRTLLLDACPVVDSLVAGATPETVRYERLTTDDLLADEHLLREAFGLLVAAHYRTEPDDLARLLCAPNLSVRALLYRGHVVSVCLLAEEGGLPPERRRAVYEGERIKGHMLPDVLTSQLCDEESGEPRGERVVRIATHGAVRSRGLGSHLLGKVRAELAERGIPDDIEDGEGESTRSCDWLGVGYGATPQLIEFWQVNDFRTVHVSTTRNETSGEHSLLMLAGLSDRGEALAKRHADRFVQRFPAVLSDALFELDPDVARRALASAGVAVSPDLSPQEWRVVCKAGYGPGLYDSDPSPFRRLALAYFTDRGSGGPEFSEVLSVRKERLLVSRVFQARPPETVAEALDYESERQCLRALGDAYAALVDRYGSDLAHRERERYE